MRKMKTLLATVVLGAVTLGLYSGAGSAADNLSSSQAAAPTQVEAQGQAFHHRHWHHRCHMRGRHRNPWHLGLNRDKQLTTADAKVIAQAALLMRGHHDLQVGSIETKVTKHGFKFYVITIVNQSNQTVTRVVLNSKNGHLFPYHAKR